MFLCHVLSAAVGRKTVRYLQLFFVGVRRPSVAMHRQAEFASLSSGCSFGAPFSHILFASRSFGESHRYTRCARVPAACIVAMAAGSGATCCKFRTHMWSTDWESRMSRPRAEPTQVATHAPPCHCNSSNGSTGALTQTNATFTTCCFDRARYNPEVPQQRRMPL